MHAYISPFVLHNTAVCKSEHMLTDMRMCIRYSAEESLLYIDHMYSLDAMYVTEARY